MCGPHNSSKRRKARSNVPIVKVKKATVVICSLIFRTRGPLELSEKLENFDS